MTGTVSAAKAKKARSPPAHPPFVEMITTAMVSLKVRTGSSQYSITNFVEEKNKFVAAGQLNKVKNSFKLPPVRSAAPAKEKAAAAAPKLRKSAAKPKAKDAANRKAKAVAAKPKAAAAKTKVKAVATSACYVSRVG